jgi:uncharacterized protein
MNYIRRNIEAKLLSYISNERALFILGARQVGKTTLMLRMREIVGESNSLFFDLENPEHLSMLSRDVNEVLRFVQLHRPHQTGRIYVFIDEIQYLDDFSHTIKYLVDHHSEQFKLIMSGSSSLQIKKSFTESLVGRKDVVDIYPLSFAEFCRFRGEDQLSDAIVDLTPELYTTLPVAHGKLQRLITEYCTYGAYPRVVLSERMSDKIELLRDITNSYILKDVKHLFRIEKLDQFNLLLRYLAINLGKELNIRAISNTVGLYWETVQKHVLALSEAYIIEIVRPFFKNLTTEIRKMPKVYFLDMGTRNSIMNDFNTLDMRPDRGEVFENFVYLQLFYGMSILSEIKFWKTRSGQEIDFIVTDNSNIKAYEVKYGESTKNNFQAFSAVYPDAKCTFVRYPGN